MTTRAGLPATTAPSGTSLTTTDPAPISEPSPISHAGKDRAVGADARQAAHGGAALAVLVARAPHRVRVVGEDDVGPHEHVVLDGHQLEEAAAVDAHAAADAVAELQDGVGADADVVAEPVALADAGALAGLEARADDAAGVDGRERAHDGAGPDGERTLALPGAPRRLADDARRLQVVTLTQGDVGVQLDVGRHALASRSADGHGHDAAPRLRVLPWWP